MASTPYVNDSEPPISAEWLNDVDDLNYTVMQNAKTAAEARAALGVSDGTLPGGNPGEIGIGGLNILTTIFGTLLSSNDDTVIGWTTTGANLIPNSQHGGISLRGLAAVGTSAWGINNFGVYSLNYAAGTAIRIGSNPGIINTPRTYSE